MFTAFRYNSTILLLSPITTNSKLASKLILLACKNQLFKKHTLLLAQSAKNGKPKDTLGGKCTTICFGDVSITWQQNRSIKCDVRRSRGTSGEVVRYYIHRITGRCCAILLDMCRQYCAISPNVTGDTQRRTFVPQCVSLA